MAIKIRLELESLDVQSFATESAPKERGTVRGNACSESTCFQDLCTCTDAYGNCYASNVNCSGGTGTGTGTGPGTRVETCCTGFQDLCSCNN
ncbi:MAG TPA: hypothetical protein VFJ16_29335 [Longimicrobium sp.]|nr:hypothetical protein [Longimicrobium sp.]